MAILNFPSDPSTQNPVNTYSPDSTPLASENGVTYVWDGEKWTANSGGGNLDDVYVNVNGDTMTGDLTVPSLNGGPLGGMRNALINGNFTIQQRGTSFSSPANVYTADRWWMGNAAGRNVDFTSDGPYQNAIRITNNASDNVFLRQGIEIQQGKCGPFTLGSVWTLSLWSDSNGWIGRPLGVSAFRDAGKMNDSFGEVSVTTTSFVATGETVGLFSRYALQVTIDASPAATHEMFCIGLTLPAGGFRISAVQLEPGPVATPFEHRHNELALCQRYYQTVDRMQLFAPNSNATNKVLSVPRTVTMRANPTEAGTASNGTLNLTGTASNYQVEADNVAQSLASFLSNYTADAEL